MRRSFILLSIPALLLPLPVFAQTDWYKKTATPGAGLTATLSAHDANPAAPKFIYVLKASGFPAGGQVSIVITDLNTTGPTEAARKPPSGYPYDPEVAFEKGAVLVARTRDPVLVDEKGNIAHADGVPFSVDIPDPAPGETFIVSMLSLAKKKKIGTYVKITPVPIEAKDGTCYAEAILTAPSGAAYEIRAEGFPAGDPVRVTRDSRGQSVESKVKADKDGSWVLTVQTDGGGKSSGTLTTNISGHSCKLTLALPWTPKK
jgi:hypothetical protein